MKFECWCKIGRHWAYRGVIEERNSLRAAKMMQRLYGYKNWRLRPEYSLDKPFEYRFKSNKVAA